MDKNRFDLLVSREIVGNLKRIYTPESVADAGVVTYWGAEFDFPGCGAFSRGVKECAENGLFGFTLQDERYNGAVSWWLEEMRGMRVAHEWIEPTHGTIYALCEAIRLFVQPGKRMLVLTPGYDRYWQAAERSGVETVFVPLRALARERRYAIDFDILHQAMADRRNTLLVLCQPNNPTGTAFTPGELSRIASLARQTDTAVFSDEIFAECTPAPHIRIPSYLDACTQEDQAIVCTSLGKCMSLTGVNHANVLIKNPRLKQRFVRQKYRDHYGSIDPMLYWGLVRACSPEGAEFVRTMNAVAQENRRVMVEGLQAAFPGCVAYQAGGTFVLWVDFTPCGLTDALLCRRLEEDALLYGSHGDEYGVSNQYRRFNLTVPPRILQRSMALLRAAASRWPSQLEGGENL